MKEGFVLTRFSRKFFKDGNDSLLAARIFDRNYLEENRLDLAPFAVLLKQRHKRAVVFPVIDADYSQDSLLDGQIIVKGGETSSVRIVESEQGWLRKKRTLDIELGEISSSLVVQQPKISEKTLKFDYGLSVRPASYYLFRDRQANEIAKLYTLDLRETNTINSMVWFLRSMRNDPSLLRLGKKEDLSFLENEY